MLEKCSLLGNDIGGDQVLNLHAMLDRRLFANEESLICSGLCCEITKPLEIVVLHLFIIIKCLRSLLSALGLALRKYLLALGPNDRL